MKTPWHALAVAGCLLAGLVSCQTMGPAKSTDVVSEPGIAPQTLAFTPVTFVSPIHRGEGNYPNLYAPDSYAIWVGPQVLSLRREKALKDGQSIDPDFESAVMRIHEQFLVFECHVASAFADMSIGYDAVGFRGMDVYLLTPDGRKIAPVQSIIDTSAREEQVQALKKFSRINLLIFPRTDLLANLPAPGKGDPAARLVMEGYGATFYFEWVPAVVPDQPWNPTQNEYVQAAKVGFKELYERLMQVGHVFD